MKTVATYPPAIFFVSAATVSVSLILLSFVRLPNASEYHRQGLLDLEEPISAVDHIQEGMLVDLRDGRPEPGEPGEDAGLNSKIAALPSYGTASKAPSIHSFH
jgi:hypothetical protein